MLHNKKTEKEAESLKRERKESRLKAKKKRRVKAQSANVCQRHSAKRKERKHKVLVKKIEKKRDM